MIKVTLAKLHTCIVKCQNFSGHKMLEKFEDFAFWAVTAILTAITTFVGYLVRTIFTNQQEIQLLKETLETREKQRDEDRERWARIEDNVSQINRVLMKGD